MSEAAQEYRKKYPIIQPSVVKEIAHGTTVSRLAGLVSRQMGWSREDCYELELAGFLHDIGKLELARYVRGRQEETLVIEEMRYVRLHPAMGALILQKKGYSQKIIDMVKFHHENCDGSGYPENRCRADIPEGARILRVCDVFAALTADRPYRKAFEPGPALELMIEESKNYDVRAFLALMHVVNTRDIRPVLETEDFERKLTQLIRQDKHSLFAEFESGCGKEEGQEEKL